MPEPTAVRTLRSPGDPPAALHSAHDVLERRRAVSTGDATLDAIIFLASWVFLVGILMVVSVLVPAIGSRYPKILLHGFLVAILSFVIVGVAAVVRG
jgi:hypothetical protein